VKQVRLVKWLRLSVALCALSSMGLVVSSAGAASSPVFVYQPSHAGGTLHLLATGAGGMLDPQVNYTLQYWQLYQATYDGLVAFEKVSGEDSFNVVPDLATKMPTVTNGGKTYTFTLRSGIKFSNGQTVTVKTYRRASSDSLRSRTRMRARGTTTSSVDRRA